MRLLFAASAVLALAACSKPAATALAPPPPVAPPPMAAGSPPAEAVPAAPVVVAAYLCTGGKTLQAGYPTPTTVLLVYQGRAYTLTQSTAASGARYAGFGLQWWSRGITKATLSTLKPAETIASDPGVECTAQITPMTPLAPGAPGALTADGTPAPDAALGPTSAQGAATVVQSYYALLEKRSSVEASKFRVDGTPENLSGYAMLHAQVGAPAAVQTAGAMLSVEVPLTLTGRLADGTAFKKSGKVVLKRAGDTPGSTLEQRAWRIDRISLS